MSVVDFSLWECLFLLEKLVLGFMLDNGSTKRHCLTGANPSKVNEPFAKKIPKDLSLLLCWCIHIDRES